MDLKVLFLRTKSELQKRNEFQQDIRNVFNNDIVLIKSK